MVSRSRLGLLIVVFVGALSVVGAAVALAGDVPQPPLPPSTADTTRPITYHVSWGKNQPATLTWYWGTAHPLPSGPGAAFPDSVSSCNTTINAPTKSGSTIYDSATTGCTPDVDYLVSTLSLWRGFSPSQLVGTPDYEQVNGPGVLNTTYGPCASSTWAYFGSDTVQANSPINGPYGYTVSGPVHYWSC